ncbi:MAG: NAD(P)H-hydrate dehydratase [Synechococcus sp.]|nr:NAD(P)H-hydrate dehydratase [Synechococcus sp.]
MKLRPYPLRNLPVQAIPPAVWPHRDGAHLLVTSAEMAALEEQLFSSGMPVAALMEKAALALSRKLLEQHGDLMARHGALVLVGPGHNGGDGLVVARELHLAGVTTTIWSPFERHKPLTEAHLRHCLWLGIQRLSQTPDPNGSVLWIDALLGIGQHRAPGAAIETLLEARQLHRPQALVAVDVPTGLCADSGRATGPMRPQAITTYAIGLVKTGLVQDQALAAVGELERIDLGLPKALLDTLPGQTPLGLGERDLAGRPRPPLDPAASKYQRGRLLVIAGSEAFRGAASLALAGASSSGCGSLHAALPASLANDLWQRHPHVVVSQTLPCDAQGNLCLDLPIAPNCQRLDALLIGPGIGPTAASQEGGFWQKLLAWPGLLVLDADGLNRLSNLASLGLDFSASAWLQQRQGPTWLTPHPGEFRRLFPELSAHPAPACLEAAGEAARASGACVLLKGARSGIAAPDGRRWQLLEASPSSARAGLGDVLAGHVAGVGAMAMAATGAADAVWLAGASLAHAQAGLLLSPGGQNGAASPMAVAEQLARLC